MNSIINQNHRSKCKNALSDIFSTICYVVNRSECKVLKGMISVPYFQKNNQGVRTNINYDTRNAMAYAIFDGLKNNSAFRITLDEYDLLKFLTAAYYKFLHPEEVTDDLIRTLHQALNDIKEVAWDGRVDGQDGLVPIGAGGW